MDYAKKNFDLDQEIVIFDTEYTSWEGARERGWSRPGEHKEIIQIGAIRVETEHFKEAGEFSIFVKPVKNPRLSEFITELTGISQADIDERGVSYGEALEKFSRWCGGLRLASWGMDMLVMEQNAELAQIQFPFEKDRFFDIRELFRTRGVPADDYMSSTIPSYFGLPLARHAHDGLSDARSILDGLRVLQRSQDLQK